MYVILFELYELSIFRLNQQTSDGKWTSSINDAVIAVVPAFPKQKTEFNLVSFLATELNSEG